MKKANIQNSSPCGTKHFQTNSFGKTGNIIVILCILFTFFSSGSMAQWTPVTTTGFNANNYGQMILMSDGTVLCKSDGYVGTGSPDNGNVWYKLTPYIDGSYVNGTWSTIEAMHDTRLWFSSQILKDGRLYVAGAEYGTGDSTSEVYDPHTGHWTLCPKTGHNYVDPNSEILPDGKVLQACETDNFCFTYNPTNNTYTATQSTLGTVDESAWVKLPDGSILFVDMNSTNTERYFPLTNTWVADDPCPVNLYDPIGSESGAGFLLPDGRVFFIGGTSNTAYYTPSGSTANGHWEPGPTIPLSLCAPDAGAAMMKNGKILCALTGAITCTTCDGRNNVWSTPTYFYEFDYLAGPNGVFTLVNAPGGGTSLDVESYRDLMLDLPDGTVLYGTRNSNQYYVYTPSGSSITAGKPTINSITQISCTEYVLTGTKLNGISEGAAYGDDAQMATNFPIVKLTSGSSVFYATTHDWTYTGVTDGTTSGYNSITGFTLPSGLPSGDFSLVVIANGIASDPVTFNVNPILTSTLPPGPLCTGNVFSLTPTSTVSNATITWTRASVAGISNTAITTPQTGSINEVLINTTSNPITVIYAITITGCGGSSIQNVSVVVNPDPAPLASNNITGGMVYLFANGGDTYSWSGPSFTSNQQNPSFAYTGQNGIYTVTVTVNSTGCTATATTDISSFHLYGMTQGGGSHSEGVIFHYNIPAGTLVVDCNFGPGVNGPAPSQPLGSLLQASNGKLYGMTNAGGTAGGYGALFEFDPSTGIMTKDYDFPGNSQPNGSLMQANDGNLYGMTASAGAYGYGTIFKFQLPTTLNPHGIVTVVYNFNEGYTPLVNGHYQYDGQFPMSSLLQASDGLLYGTCVTGGFVFNQSTNGTLFSFNPSNSSFGLITSFTSFTHTGWTTTNGFHPQGNLIEENGILYGMARNGGTYNQGILYEYNLSTHIVSIDYNMGATGDPNRYPQADLLQSMNGKLYGMTNSFCCVGGDDGTLFDFDPNTHAVHNDHLFNNSTSSQPNGSLMQASNGKLYGLTTAPYYGTIFDFNPCNIAFTLDHTFNGNGTEGSSPLYTTFIEVQCIKSSVPTLSATTSTICAGQSTTLNITSGNLNDETIWEWYSGSCGGTYLQSGTSMTVSPLTTTTYYARGEGCTTPGNCGSITITVNPLPSISINDTIHRSRCGTGTVTLAATAGAATLNWYDAASGGNLLGTGTSFTTPSISVTTTFYVDATENGCTSARRAVTATINPSPTPTITANGPTTFCSVYNVTLDAGSYVSYNWGNGNFTEFQTEMVSATDYVTVTDANGCTGVAYQVVTVYQNPSPWILANGPITFCQGGSVILDAGSDIDPWNYQWDNTQNSQTETITVNTSGTYTVTVTDVISLCSGIGQLIVTVNPLPAIPHITASGSTNLCQGQSVTLTSDAATGYAWNDGETTQSITVSVPNQYLVLIVDGNGCMSYNPGEVTVAVNPIPATPHITASGSTNLCQGESVILTSDIASAYAWNDGETTQSITVSVPNEYLVMRIDNNGCMSNPADITIIVNPLPAPVITPNGPTTFNQGGNVALDAGVYSSWIWSTGAITETIDVTTSGTYSITVTDGSGCTGIASQEVSVNTNAQNPIHASGRYIIGTCGDTITLRGVNYAAFNWGWDLTDDRFAQIALSGANCVRIPWYSSSAAGVGAPLYDNLAMLDSAIAKCIRNRMIPIVVLMDNSCNPDNNSLLTLSNYYLQPGVLSIINTYQSSLIIDIANEALYVQWANNQTQALIDYQNTYQTIITNMRNAGINVPLMIDAPDCGENINDLFSIAPSIQTFDPLHNMIFSAHAYWYAYANNDSAAMRNLITNALAQNVPLVLGEVANLQDGTVNCEYAMNYQQILEICQQLHVNWLSWSWDHDVCSSRQITTAGLYASLTSYGNDILNNPIYGISTHSTLTTYLANNGSCISNCITPDLPTISASTSSICNGSNTTLSIASGNLNNATNWQWYSGSCGGTPVGNGTSIIVSPIATTTYFARGEGGCVTPGSCGSITIIVTNPPTPVITANGPTTFCQGSSVTLDAGNYSSYNWGNGNLTEFQTTSTSGTYSVTVTDVNGCTGIASQVVTVNTNPTPVITANGPTTFCQGSSVTLDAGNYSSYNWSNGNLTELQLASTSGTYSVTVTDANGCTGIASQVVTVNTNPTPVITANAPTTFCQGSSVILDAGNFSSYSWSVPDITQFLNVSSSGNYAVTVSDANGCTGIASQIITVNANPVPTITGPLSICNGGQITLTTGAFTSYNWSTNSVTQSISVSNPGTYRVTVTNASGCTGIASQAVIQSAFLNPVIFGPTSACSGSTVTLGLTNVYTTYHWSTGAVTPTISVSVSGNYSVTVTTGNCSGSTHLTVTILASPVPVIVGSGLNNYCAGTSSATLTVVVFQSYHWSTGANTQSIIVPPGNPGTYSVTVTSTNGCTGVASFVLSTSCVIPSQLFTTNVAATSAMANWTQPSCVYGYTIRISKHNANLWTSYTFAPNSHYTFSALTHNSAYDWQIRTNCNATQTNVSAFSPVQTFTTLMRLENGESDNTSSSFNVYPNPATDEATIVFTSDKEEACTIRLTDITGRVILSVTTASVLGENQYQMNLSAIAKGVYMVLLQKGDAVLQSKIVVQ